MKNLYLLAIVCLFIGSGCGPEELPDYKDANLIHEWKNVEGFNFAQQINLNSHVSGDRLIISQPGHIATVMENEDGTYDISSKFSYSSPNVRERMPITDNILIEASEKCFTIFNTYELPKGYNDKLFCLNQFDENAKYIKFLHSSLSDNIVCNNHQILVPYSNDINGDTTSAGADFLLLDYKVQNGDIYEEKVLITDYQKLTFPFMGGWVLGMQAFDDYFIVKLAYATFLVNKNGETTELDLQVAGNYIFENNTFYVFNKLGYYSSKDLGKTWHKISDIDQTVTRLNFAFDDDKIIGYTADELYEVNISDSDYSVRKLYNIGLENNYITSVSHFHDKMIVTTLSGVYEKDIENFWD